MAVHTYCSTLKREYIEKKKSEEILTEITENNRNSSEERYITKCICKNDRDTDNMIQCDSCGTWQHMKCEGIDINVNLDNKYYKCNACKKIEEDDMNWVCYWCTKLEKTKKRKSKKNTISDVIVYCFYF